MEYQGSFESKKKNQNSLPKNFEKYKKNIHKMKENCDVAFTTVKPL